MIPAHTITLEREKHKLGGNCRWGSKARACGKRYRRKKKACHRVLPDRYFGAIFVAALAVMKTVGVLGPPTPLPRAKHFRKRPRGKGEGIREQATGFARALLGQSRHLIAQEPAPDGSQRNIQSKTGAVL